MLLNLHPDEYDNGDGKSPTAAAAAAAADLSSSSSPSRCRGALVHVHPNGKSGWRPFPWNHVPDKLAVAATLCVLLPVAPIMAALIGGAVLWWELCRLLYRPLNGPYWQRLRDRVSQAVADKIMHEPRNAPYLPYMAFITVWAPALLALAYYRQ
jgi:nitrogen fixation-related uncharacterized protein